MAVNVDKFVTTAEHASIDHTGLPGVGIGSPVFVGPSVIETDTDFFTGASPPAKVIAANTLTEDNQALWIKYAGDGGSGGGPTFTFTFAGTTILTIAVGSAEVYQVSFFVVRTGAATARAVATIVGAAGVQDVETTSFAADWTTALNFGVSSAGGTNEEHRLYQAIVWPNSGVPGLPGIGSDTLPIGVIVPFGGPVSAVPTGFRPCDGTAVGRTGGDPDPEADLFLVIGTNWGVGDGATTYNLPDLRGKSPVGLNDGTLPAGEDGGFSTRVLGAIGGEESHVLTLSELASHSHTETRRAGLGNLTDDTGASQVASTTVQNQGTSSEGSDAAHNTMHPFAVCPYIIKARQVGGGNGTSVQVNAGSVQGPQPVMNFLPGPNVSVVAVANVPQTRIDIDLTIPDVIGQAEAEAGVATAAKLWTAERVAQAIAALIQPEYAVQFGGTLSGTMNSLGGTGAAATPVGGRVTQIAVRAPGTAGTISGSVDIDGNTSTFTGISHPEGVATLSPIRTATAGGRIDNVIVNTTGAGVNADVSIYVEP